MSLSLSPEALSTAVVAYAGPSRSSSNGSHDGKAYSRRYALGVRPSSLALSSLMMSVHAAPSVKYEAVAAVTVPCGLTKAGLSLAMLSAVESPRMPSSSVLPLTATISSSKMPSACALAAFWCERAAKASWSAREMPKRSASRSALCPITSPVSMLAMAGVSGARCESLRPLRMDLSLPIGALIFCERMSFLRIGREKRMAASEKVSTPPAITTSARPVWICCTPLQMAWLADIHACVTVWPVTEFGRPEPSATSRAMLLVRISCETVPHRR
mmetsp:Transcript_42847/g.102944  ORF Transcript_42847/g.102944 Transcript_42847/m.102944 type:complete len:272 (-) Transcript_42847:236-1051(-)